MTRDCCDLCRFYRRPSEHAFGTCHRMPPTPSTHHLDHFAVFPEVRAMDWCGEFQPEPPAATP